MCVCVCFFFFFGGGGLGSREFCAFGFRAQGSATQDLGFEDAGLGVSAPNPETPISLN